jgi:hypothetical protein
MAHTCVHPYPNNLNVPVILSEAKDLETAWRIARERTANSFI